MNRGTVQRDIATLLGLSQSTVSLAMRDHPSIAAKTRHLVKQAASEMGYVSNPLVSTLMACRRKRLSGVPPLIGNLAVITRRREPISRSRRFLPFYTPLWKGMHDRAGELGFSIEEFPLLTMGLSPQRLDHVLQSRGISGVILFPSGDRTQEFPELTFEKYSMVCAGHAMSKMTFHEVTSDYSHGMLTALSVLKNRGLQRIGFALPGNKTLDANLRYSLSSRFLSYQHDIPAKHRIPFLPDCNEGTAPEVIMDWIRRYRPEVVLGVHHGLLRKIRSEGIRVPEELSYVDLSIQENIGQSGIDQKTYQVGVETLNLLASQIFHNLRGVPEHPLLTLVKGLWVDGNSLRT